MMIVAALLSIPLTIGMAAAADPSEHLPKSAQKILATLEILGINNKDIKDLVAETNSHIDPERRYYHIAERQMMGGKLDLRFALQSGASIRNMELRFAPDDSHMAITAHTNAIMVGYHWSFE